MHKFALTIALAIMSCYASANEWTFVTSSINGDTYFADKTTITKNGSKANIIVMQSYKSTQQVYSKIFSSTVYIDQFDCEEGKIIILGSAYYSGNMGDGSVIYATEADKKWSNVDKSSIADAIMKLACGVPVTKGNNPDQSVAQRDADQKYSYENILKQEVRIGNSSVFAFKFELDSGKIPISVALRGPISKNDVIVFKKILAPYIDKNYFKKNPIPAWYKSNPEDVGYTVVLDSNGGDIYSAMEIGRIFRKARVKVNVNSKTKCLSACVLLIAGSVRRDYPNYVDNVGIHRPYSTDVEAATFDKIQSRTNKLGADVSSYFSEMNIPTILYDSMKLTKPDDIRMLSIEELKAFGLYDDDPVFSELNDNVVSKLAHISKSEYFARKALSDQCKLEGYQGLENSALKGKNYFEYLLQFRKMENECEEKTIYRDVIAK